MLILLMIAHEHAFIILVACACLALLITINNLNKTLSAHVYNVEPRFHTAMADLW